MILHGNKTRTEQIGAADSQPEGARFKYPLDYQLNIIYCFANFFQEDV
jgi:hypothetical protein